MKLIKINNINFGHVIKSDEIEQIINTNALIETNKEKARILIEHATQEAQQILVQEKEKLLSNLLNDNKLLIDQSKTKIEEKFQQINENLTQIIEKVLVNLGFHEINYKKIYELVISETNKFSEIKLIKIKAPSEFIDILNQETKNLYYNVIFESDDSLSNGVCICESNFWIMSIDYEKTKALLLSGLNDCSKLEI